MTTLTLRDGSTIQIDPQNVRGIIQQFRIVGETEDGRMGIELDGCQVGFFEDSGFSTVETHERYASLCARLGFLPSH